MILICSYLY